MIRILKKIISSNFIVSVLIVVSAILSCINKKVDYIEPYALIYHNLTPENCEQGLNEIPNNTSSRNNSHIREFNRFIYCR